jgi:hypothetical protein
MLIKEEGLLQHNYISSFKILIQLEVVEVPWEQVSNSLIRLKLLMEGEGDKAVLQEVDTEVFINRHSSQASFIKAEIFSRHLNNSRWVQIKEIINIKINNNLELKRATGGNDLFLQAFEGLKET